MKTDGIYGFKKDYHFLSNFARLDRSITYLDLEFWYSENAYQAAKCLKVSDRKQFMNISPAKAKLIGQKVECRLDWKEVRISVMKEVCLLKFQKNPRMREKLLETGDLYLEETNTWGDVFWGVCKGYGQNELGKLLMEIRKELNSSLIAG